MFYTIQNNQIITAGTREALTKYYGEENVETMVQDYEIGKYIVQDGELIENINFETEKANKLQDKINHLTMTALDFIKAVKSMGLTDEQVENYLNQNLDVKHQLMFCQNVYCGVVKQLCPISIGEVNITEAQVEALFKAKYNIV